MTTMTLKNKVTSYFGEARTELQKVIWPSKRDTARYTLLVVGACLGMGVFFAALDFLFSKGLELLIDR